MKRLKLYFLKKWLTEYLNNIQYSLVSLAVDLGHADLSEEELVWRMVKQKEYYKLEKVLVAVLNFMEEDK